MRSPPDGLHDRAIGCLSKTYSVASPGLAGGVSKPPAEYVWKLIRFLAGSAYDIDCDFCHNGFHWLTVDFYGQDALPKRWTTGRGRKEQDWIVAGIEGHAADYVTAPVRISASEILSESPIQDFP